MRDVTGKWLSDIIICPQIVPRMIAENAGLSATEVIGQLKAAHARGESQAGLDIESGKAADLSEQGIVDLFSAKVGHPFAIGVSSTRS